MRALRPALAVPFLLAVSAPLAAQATRDQARLVFNVGLGYVNGPDLWRVAGQPLIDDSSLPAFHDSLALTRNVEGGLTFGLKGIYYPGAHFGFVGEAHFMSLGLVDGCNRTVASISPRNQEVCASINGSERSASAVQVGTGLIYRVNSRGTLSPYARGTVGVTVTNRSYVAMTGTFENSSGNIVQVDVYPGPNSTRVNLAGTLALGMTAVLAPGYQVRWEVRDNIAGMREVTGPSVRDGVVPPSSIRYRHLFGVEVGFDVILERRRGRRY